MNPIDNQFFQDQIKRRELESAMYQQQMDKSLNPPQQQDGGGGGMPGGMGIAQKFMGGGAAGGGTAASSGGTVAGAGSGPVVGTPLAAEGGSAAGGGSGSSAMASAGPWAALAAAIYLRETNARDKGHRAEDDKTYAVDAATGNLGMQDLELANQKYLGNSALGNDVTGMTDFSQGDFGNGFSSIREGVASPVFDGYDKLEGGISDGFKGLTGLFSNIF